MSAAAHAVLPLAEVQAHLQAHLPRWTVSDGAIRRTLPHGPLAWRRSALPH